MNWSWHRFEDLGVDNLYDALALRCRVFVIEQGPYLDPDGVDRACWHLLGRDHDQTLHAYLRVVDPGRRYPEPSIGRVITSPEKRGSGLGRMLMQEGIRRCEAAWPRRDIRISAQARLQRFYESLGFAVDGDEYLEDNIAHIVMLKRARS